MIIRYTLSLIVMIGSFGLIADEHDDDQLGTWDAYVPEVGDPPITWLDKSHAYLTNQTQSLAGWMDSFFGDPTHDADKAESFIRLEWIEDWNSEDSSEDKFKIRGRVQLPRLSKRLSITFSGEESEFGEENIDRELDDSIGLQFRAAETSRSRLDYTLGYASGRPRPGIRFRMEGPIGQKYSYRLTERIQYEHGENFFSKSQFRLNRRLDNNSLIGWGSEFIYGGETEGVEWRSNISFQTRYRVDRSRPIAVAYYIGTAGFTRPDNYISNYNIGLLFRRQVYRDFLFLELEPSFNYRKIEAGADRKVVWRIVARLEIAVQKDLRLVR